ncbi:Tat pathway signal sequence domain protein [Streptomyces sp. B1866]|uniref:Tat pathway signal sequence domain protein n=1 Tax=Streptomyces sp. B1866 TaxID=3075431 RepID=UPI00288EC723|nr:Tat pathway signal sequence domain protein [Streptomyces sp. B1866]MDT3396433.1 Tat pathway signal sequence domain protein [Streptomyces sp. B1866]
MRVLVRRHLGKAVAGAAVAVTATAAMLAVTLPGDAAGGSRAGRDATGVQGAAGEPADGGQPAAPGRDRPGVVEEAPEQGARGVGWDPLTEEEMRRAQDVALARVPRGASRDAAGGAGPQRLTTSLAEPPEREADGSAPRTRRADVSYYDYADDAYVTRTVDLGSGRVEHTAVQHGVQPPPVPDEARAAARVLIADRLGAGLRADYRDATGRELTGPGQLTVSAFVYRAATEGSAGGKLAECGRHRCVRLFTRVANGPWIDTRDLVVDLSARTVTRVR